MTSKYKTFTDYYRTDPEFKKKHLQRLNEKIECDCGFVTSRGNLSRHKHSHLHVNKILKLNRITELKEELEKLEKEIRK